MSSAPGQGEDPRLEEILNIIFKFAAGDLQAMGSVSETGDAVDGVMAGINILGEELEAYIAELKQSQQAQAESEAMLRCVFDSVQDGIIVAEAESRRFTMLNSTICRMLGYSNDELLELGMDGIHPEKDLPSIALQFERLARGEIRIAPDLPMKRKDGSVFYADVKAGPMTIGGVTSLVGVFRDITKRKQAEGKIQKLNEALKKKVDQLTEAQGELEQHRADLEQEVARQTASLTEAQRIAHLGNWEWDLVNDRLNWSDEIYRIFGLVPKQFDASYKAFLDAVHPEDRQFVDDSVHNALDRQGSYDIDHRILRPDGTLRHVHEQAEVIHGEDEQPISMVGTVQDITERKQAEDQIRKQQEITSQIIETIPMRVFWKDRALHYLGCNTAFARDAGKNSPDEILGKDDFQMGWKDQAELYRADDRRVMDTDTSKLSYDEPQTTPTGEQIWLRTSKVPLHNEANEVIAILGVYEDITEYKRMELKFLESEKRFRNLAELTTDWVWQVDEHGTYVYSGAKIQDILGYDPEEIIGKTPFDFMPPEEAARVAEIFQDIVSKQKPFSFMENINLHKDGHKVILETSAVPLFTDDGTFNGYFGTERDITERKQVEEQIRNLNEELEDKVRERTKQLIDTQDELVRKEKLSTLGQVAGSVGHELRNPLGVMNNAVYFLQTVLSEADETTREYLGILKDEIANADRIVGDLLDSVRTKPPQKEAIDVKALIEQTLGKCEIPAGVTVKLEIPETLSPLLVDAWQIHQVFRNLISNGAEAMSAGGTLEIAAVENNSEKTITISVRDNGSGITPAGMARLFQPLFTTKTRGIGLGLVVVKNLTEANGGTVEVQSEVGKGTSFSVTLPASRSAAEED